MSHLSRAIRGKDKKSLSPGLFARIASALEVSPDYFGEVREAVVVHALRENPRLRDEIYDRLSPEERRRGLAEFEPRDG